MKLFKNILRILLILLLAFVTYQTVSVFQARLKTGEIFEQALLPENTPLKLADIGKERIDILLKIEDPAFFSHNGIDLKTPGAGITTITQGMVKYLYFKKFKPGFAKLKQSLIARFAVDAMISKEDQLTVFINTAYFGTMEGKTIRGFSRASDCYFGRPFAELSDDQYLALVAMLVGPDHFNVRKHPERNRQRVERIKAVLTGDYAPVDLGDVYYTRGQILE